MLNEKNLSNCFWAKVMVTLVLHHEQNNYNSSSLRDI
jgi:hypothetical protein